MNVTVLVGMRPVTVDVCMCVFVPGLIYMSVFMKMLMSVNVTVFMII